MAESRPPVARNQLDKCGTRVRHAAEIGEDVPNEIRSTIDAFRGWHLETVTHVEAALVGLFHDSAKLTQDKMPITSRAKTLEAILAKLRRQPTSLARMQDIAGSRIVVPTLEAQQIVVEGVVAMFEDEHVATTDNRETGDRHGYRAVHVIVRVDGRFAEIQVRTRAQDGWANLVEAMDDAMVKRVLEDHPQAAIEAVRKGIDFKHGVGPPETLAYLVEMSAVLRQHDLGDHSVPAPAPPPSWRTSDYEER